jgi:non-canonical purine NTP pyrophosphatase (RdgB/HAM1 family)
MANVTFITGNQHKADRLARYLGHPVEHAKIDLDEIQSLNLREVIEHKAKQAHGRLMRPILVDDIALEFHAIGNLPGPFVKWFIEGMGLETMCRLLDGKDRTATGRCTMAYYDGANLSIFEGSIRGTIAAEPSGDGGYGWDSIFIPDGYEETRAQLTEKDYEKVYRQIRPYDKLKEFLESL